MKGDIRIDRERPEWDNVNPINRNPTTPYRGFACEHLCMALLFTPGVTSVTINNSDQLSEREQRDGAGGFDPEARTYWLLPKVQCAGRAVLPDLQAFAPTPLSAQWNLRLASDVCLVRSGPIAHHNLLIRQGEYGRRDWWNDDWYLGPGGPIVEYVEIRNAAGETLLRRFKSSVSVPSHVLYIDMFGGIENFRFGWGRQTLTNKPEYNAIDLWREVDSHTFVERALTTADPLPLSASGANSFIEQMPRGSFAVLTADERRLLAMPDKRAGLYALTGRLDDGGPRNVPLILSLIRDESRDRHAKLAAADRPGPTVEIGNFSRPVQRVQKSMAVEI